MPFSDRRSIAKKNKNMKSKIPQNVSLPAASRKNATINSFNDIFRERVSSSASQASLTLETAFVLPLFIMLIICVIQIIEIVSIQIKLNGTIHQVSKELAHYAYIYDKMGTDEESVIEEIVAGGLSVSYVRSQIISDLGQDYLDNSIIRNGSSGLWLYQSSILGENDIVDIVVKYKISIRYNIFNIPDVSVVQRARTRAWTGSDDIVGSGSGDSSISDMVYVAANGVVYHKDRECTHLRLSVSETSLDNISDLRNQNGGKYYSCERCQADSTGVTIVYITETGDRYHSSLGCSGLKRDISTISILKIGTLTPCLRCGQ